ncbi:TcpD family membrane protein [Streptacidiphilus sp. EB103A]|uniref:TcpD family membrane protein n=1 Tax=Streptacidiphilus sp. EB103A TaxID=3156275 RepID=UPI003518B86E
MAGNSLVSWALTIVGSLFGLVLGVRAFGHWAKKEWGALITHFVGAAVVAFMIFSPDQAVTILKLIGAKLASVFTG